MDRFQAGYPIMPERRTLEELKQVGEGKPATPEIASLYLEAFRRFGAQALWSRKPSVRPSIAQALVVAESLRREGDMIARALAVKIEEACRAAL
jgi:hypothetical protein